MHRLPILTLVLLTLVSCHNSYDRRLTRAESLMNTHPDSALLLLDEIADVQKLSAANRAYYALEHTRACDKLGILPPNDSLINVAVGYYARHGNDEEQTLAYFYQGLVYRKLNNPNQALTAFLHSLKHIDSSNPDRLLQIIYQNIGYLYYNQHLYSQSLEMYLKGHKVAKALQDSALIAKTSRYIGINYDNQNKADSALVYFNQALSYTSSKDSAYISKLLSDVSLCYLSASAYKQADSCISASTRYRRLNGIGSLIKGVALYHLNQKDVAYPYILDGIAEGDASIKRNAYQILYLLEKSYDHDSLAYQACDSLLFYDSKLNSVRYQDELAQQQAQYENSLLQQEFRNKRNIIVGVVLLAFLLLAITFYMYDRRQKQSFFRIQRLLMENRRKILELKNQDNQLAPTTEESENTPSNQAELFELKREKLSLCMQSLQQDEQFVLLKQAAHQKSLSLSQRYQIRQMIVACFSEVMEDLNEAKNLSIDDQIHCVYMAMGISYHLESKLTGTSEEALRTRKRRLKQKISPEMFLILSEFMFLKDKLLE